MGAVSGVSTTYNLVNYLGTLFKVTPDDTPLVTMMGGLRGWAPVNSKIFTWQTVDNTAAAQPAIVEAADPDYYERTRSEVSNCTQIFQYGVKIGYSQWGATDQLSSTAQTILGTQPIGNELTFQKMLTLERCKRDLEYSCIRGAYQYPTDNNTGRKMQGLENAISTNSVSLFTTIGTVTGANAGDLWTHGDAHGLVTGDEVQFSAVGTGGTGFAVDTPYWVIYVGSATFTLASSLANALAGTIKTMSADTVGTWTLVKSAKLAKGDVNKLLRTMYDAGAPFRQPVIFCNSFNKQVISDIYGYAPDSRNVGGVNINQIETDIGNLGIVIDRHIPASKLIVADMSILRLRAMPIPERGVLFFEETAKTGAYTSEQLYGELGLEYGYEAWHGIIKGSTTDEQS